MKHYEKPEIMVQTLSTGERLMVDKVNECTSSHETGPMNPRPDSPIAPASTGVCIYTDKNSI